VQALWLDANIVTGLSGDRLVMHASANNSTTVARTTAVMLTAGPLKAQITVTQNSN
jgi:hypothetical protein